MWLQHRRRGSYIGGGRQFSWRAHLCILWNVRAKTCPWGKGALSLSLLSLPSASAISWHLCANDFILNLFSGQAQNSQPTNYILFYRIVIITAEAALPVESGKRGSLLERMWGRNAPSAKCRDGYFDKSHGHLKSRQHPKEQMRITCPPGIIFCSTNFSAKVYWSQSQLKQKQHALIFKLKQGILFMLGRCSQTSLCVWALTMIAYSFVWFFRL